MALPTLPTAENDLGSVADLDTHTAAMENDMRRLVEALSVAMQADPRKFGGATHYTQVGSGGLSFAGDARPTRIWSPVEYFGGSAGKSGAATGHYVEFPDALDRDAYYNFGRMPSDVDVSADIVMRALLYVASPASTNLQAIIGGIYYGARVGAMIAASAYPTAHLTFNGGTGTWAANTPELHTLLTIPGGTLSAGDEIDVRVVRNGTNVVNDTLATGLRMLDPCWFEYRSIGG